MHSDLATRVLLASILLCLLVLLGQSMGLLPSAGSAVVVPETGRYLIEVAPHRRGELLLVRTDTVTGLVWRKALTSDGPWVLVDQEFPDDSDLEPVVPAPANESGPTPSP